MKAAPAVGSGRTRDSGLDAARAILMLLGILLHAANLYASQFDWLVNDPVRYPVFGWISRGIHLFRMPAFFCVAGYFVAMVHDQRGAGELMRSRIERLLLPLVVGVLTLNVAQELLVAWAAGEPGGWQALHLPQLYHLWFLVDLMLFTAAAVPLLRLVERFTDRPWALRAPGLPAMIGFVIVVALVLELLVRSTGLAYVELFGLTTPYRLARHLPFFALGLLLFRWPAWRERFFSMPGWWFWPALVAWAVVDRELATLDGPGPELRRVVATAAGWVCVGAVLSFLQRRFARETPLVRLISDSAYTIYLSHHLVVIALGLLLAGSGLSPFLKYPLVCAVTIALCLGLHLGLVRRSAVCGLLLNGRRGR